MKYIEIKSPAKINLGLNIVAKRVDGFHDLETFFYPLNELCDVITIRNSDNFSFKCDNPLLPSDETNLVVKAVRKLEKLYSRKFNVEIGLKKIIPAGAGLGGGSSNAGTVLICLNEMFGLKINSDQLSKLALELGSDVPFFIQAKPAVGKSRGEILNFSNFEIKKPILVVNPGIHISTKEAFENIAPSPPSFNYDYFLKNEKPDFEFLRKNLSNDFENYVFSKYAEVQSIKDLLYESGAELSLMSGTGSTVFGIFRDENLAESATKKLPDKYFKFICYDRS